MVALVLTIGLTAETIEGLVRVRVAEFEPFFHCKVSISGYVCTPPGAVLIYLLDLSLELSDTL